MKTNKLVNELNNHYSAIEVMHNLFLNYSTKYNNNIIYYVLTRLFRLPYINDSMYKCDQKLFIKSRTLSTPIPRIISFHKLFNIIQIYEIMLVCIHRQ